MFKGKRHVKCQKGSVKCFGCCLLQAILHFLVLFLTNKEAARERQFVAYLMRVKKNHVVNFSEQILLFIIVVKNSKLGIEEIWPAQN